jgi:hypothetical protein
MQSCTSPEFERLQYVRDALHDWVAAEPKRLERVWGRKKFKRSAVIGLEVELDRVFSVYPSTKTNHCIVAVVGF